MGNFQCNNYYCQNVSFKPEWLSESAWEITFNHNQIKPYIIDKGILKINNVNKFKLLLTKKLILDFNEVRNISIPINFKYKINKQNYVDIFLIFSNNPTNIEKIDKDMSTDNLFFIKLKLIKNNITICRSFNDKIINKRLKTDKINSFIVTIENNFKFLLVTEKLYNNNIINIYEDKYLNNITFTDIYLSLYIVNKNELIEKEFIELNFE